MYLLIIDHIQDELVPSCKNQQHFNGQIKINATKSFYYWSSTFLGQSESNGFVFVVADCVTIFDD